MNETDYISGSRAAWLSMLQTCLRELGVDDPAAGQARWVSEREQTVAMLRQVCERYGDNDWPDTLHLADVVDKHLGKYLAADTLNRSRFTDIEGDYSHATTGGYARAVTAGDCARLYLRSIRSVRSNRVRVRSKSRHRRVHRTCAIRRHGGSSHQDRPSRPRRNQTGYVVQAQFHW